VSVNPGDLFSQERSDLSNFLIHLTKNGSYEIYEDYTYIPGHYQFKKSANLEADSSLKSILGKDVPILEARAPFGHFKFDISIYSKIRRAVPLEWLKCVCFSETPLRELRSFYRSTQQSNQQAIKLNSYQSFGLAFFADFLRKKGAHPLFYFDSRNDHIYQAVDKLADPQFLTSSRTLLPLFEAFGPAKKSTVRTNQNEIDFRWEREWRHVGDLKFLLSDVAFGLCPEKRINEFDALSKGHFPFIDPDWDTVTLSEYLISKGRKDLAEAL
jgi:hypothetical protein